MKRDLQIGLLAAIAAIVPSLLLAALGVSVGLYLVVVVGCGTGIVVAFGRRWHRQAVTRTESQTTHLRSAIGIAATAGGIPTYWTEHSITPETLTQIQQLIAALGVRRVLELGFGPVDPADRPCVPAGRRRRGAVARRRCPLGGADRGDPGTRRTLGLCRGPRGAVRDITAGGRTAPWYDLSGVGAGALFDLVIVDGPPAWKGDRLARLPALYELRKHLGENGVLVLDDAGRDGEAEIARQWQRDFPDLHFRMVGVGRGLFVASVQKSTLDLLPV